MYSKGAELNTGKTDGHTLAVHDALPSLKCSCVNSNCKIVPATVTQLDGHRIQCRDVVSVY